jgi:hypothetical protein
VSDPAKDPELVLCIPGPWKERSQLVESIVRRSSGYIFAGHMLMDLETKHTCQLLYQSADPAMQNAFEVSGPHWRGSPEMAAIAQHQSVVYLVGRGGSDRNAHAMMLAAAGIVKAGGFGVKVESSGLSHSGPAWLQFCDDLHLLSAHEALVVYVTSDEVFSCGMHNLGLPDAITTARDKLEAAELLRVFTRYVYSESPVIRAGQSFSTDKNAPIYRLLKDQGARFEEGSLYSNPYGTWRLAPIAMGSTSRR